MPKEIKKRGRRAEKKQKEERELEEAENPNLTTVTTDREEVYSEYYSDGAQPEDPQFYGLLTDEEAEYFRGTDEVLENNAFNDPEERGLFIANVYREADGKELKIASSQGCSRLLEKLILLSTPAQLKKLWKVFTGHFLNLVQHRFASHCCEILFERSVVIASRELDPDYVVEGEMGVEGEEVFASMESLFLFMLNELEPQLLSLLSHRFASHPIRALLLILSGQPISSSQSLVQSRKKKNISIVSDFAPPEERELGATIQVPESFTEALERIIGSVGAGLSVEDIRAMAVHQIGSPTLQVLLHLEMQKSRNERKKGKEEVTLLGKLTGISGEKEGEDNEEKPSSFFVNLLYDPVGSHLAEKIVSYASKKEFKKLYKSHFKTRMGSLARNETAGFVVVRVLEKLSKEVLQEATKEIVKEIGGMIGEFLTYRMGDIGVMADDWEIERGQVTVIKTLIDCCGKQSVDASEIATAISDAYNCTSEQLIFKMLVLTPEALVPKQVEEGKEPPRPRRDPKQRHGSLLAQSMLQLPGEFHRMICESLVVQTSVTVSGLSQHPQGSHVIQSFLLSPHSTTPDKRKLLNLLRGSWAELAIHPGGSHIVDAAWTATNGIMNYKQSIAMELMSAEAEIRESFFGRTVWRNWSMDKYKTRRNEWFNLAKEASLSSSVGALKLNNTSGGGGAQGQGQIQGGERKKTALELARERHGSAKRVASGQPRTGSNAVAASKRQRVA